MTPLFAAISTPVITVLLLLGAFYVKLHARRGRALANTSAPQVPQPVYVEEPAFYPFNISLTSGQALTNIPVNIDRDSDFLLTGINGSSTGTFNMNFRLPSGRLISNQQIAAANLLGTANQPTAIGPPPIYRAGSTGPQLDLTDTSGAGNTLQIIFSGIRRLRTS